jgi:putative transposase
MDCICTFWVCPIGTQPKHCPGLPGEVMSNEGNMLIAERFILSLINKCGEHPVPTGGGGTWYPQACRFLILHHQVHSSHGKSLMERSIQYIKDRIESFDDYFPCGLKKFKLKHVQQWSNLSIDQHKRQLMAQVNNSEERRGKVKHTN